MNTQLDSPPPIVVEGDSLRVRFERFGPAAYEVFLKVKRLPEYRLQFHEEDDSYTVTAPARFAPMLGVDLPGTLATGLPISDFLFDDQRAIVQMALDAKRFACWSDCGLGKTNIGLEVGRQVNHRTGQRVLIVTLNEIVPQWLDECRKFYGDELPLTRLESRMHMKEWCATGGVEGQKTAASIAVTNYEKFNHRTESEQVVNELRHLGGIILDESSRLKTGGGKQKWAVIKSAKGIENKLSLTATPAPNEIMEFASQASFLEKMRSDSEIIWTYFRRDEKTHRWTVKQHARAAFFEFMAGWSIYVRDPRRYGWRLGIEPPPEPEYFHHTIALTPQQRALIMDVNADPRNTAERNLGSMFAGELNAMAANRLSQAAKGFLYGPNRKPAPVNSLKPGFVAELIASEVLAGLQTLVWTVFDEESRILSEMLAKMGIGAELLTGATKPGDRLAILERFRLGQTPALISRAGMLGYGMNLQHCRSMVFSGSTFSYESFYQAVRRAYRHGQTHRLRVHIPIIQELEGQMWDAIGRKQKQHEEAIAEMEANYIRAFGRIGLTKERAA